MIIAECLKSRLEKQGCTVSMLSIAGKRDVEPTSFTGSKLPKYTIIRRQFLSKTYAVLPASVKAYLAWRRRKHRATRVEWEQAVAKSDLVIVGGGQLISNGSAPRIAEIMLASKQHSKPVAVFSVGIDPSLDTLARLILRRAMKNVFWASARSKLSSDALGDLVPHLRCGITPDPAVFSNLEYLDRPKKRTSAIGFNLENLIDLRDYLGTCKVSADTFVDRLLSTIGAVALEGYPINLFTNGDPRDQDFAEVVFNRVKQKGFSITLRPRPTSTAELISLVAENKLNVCFRLHASIVSLSLRIPFLAFPWDSKVIDVMNLFGQVDRVVEDNFWVPESASFRTRRILAGLESPPVVDENFFETADAHIEALLAESSHSKGWATE